jgi:hypothetical protein
MIDYRSLIVALDKFRLSLAASAFNDPAVASLRDRHLAEVAAVPEMAVLGSLIDHLIWHASSDGTELRLLERAANLWQQGLALYNTMSGFRADLEGALADPTNPASPAKFNAAALTFQQLSINVIGKKTEIDVLKEDIQKYTYLRAHPRQQDKPLDEWSWADVFLSRRTDAFSRSVRKHASDPPTSAFAFGVLSGYGANACGSAYLGQVVGGPRRSHRHRDRLARNTVGSWFARSYPSVPTLAALAKQIRYGGSTPMLPASIETLITGSLTATFNLSRTPPPPDLQLGYRRLVRHLELLSVFIMPPLALLPIDPFLTRIYGNPTDPLVSLVSAANVGVGTPGSGAGVTPQSNTPGGGSSPNSTDSPTSAGDACGSFWEAIALLVIFLGGGFIDCIAEWGQGHRCKIWDMMAADFKKAFSSGQGPQVSGDPPYGVTSDGLTAASGVDQVTELVGQLFDLQCLFWSAMDSAFDYLSVYGLIYPDKLGAIDTGRYPQFLTIPATPKGSWPHLPQTNPVNLLHMYPSTGVEQPAATTTTYQPGSPPSVFIAGLPGILTITAADISGMVWHQTANGVTDAINYDLDADRGLQHPCWIADGSINDNPINVVHLPYADT